MPLLPAPKRDEERRKPQYAPRDRGPLQKLIKFRVALMERKTIEGYPPICIAESDPKYLHLAGFRHSLALRGAKLPFEVSFELGGNEYRTLVQVPFDGPEDQILDVNLWDCSTQTKRRDVDEFIARRDAVKISTARDTTVRD